MLDVQDMGWHCTGSDLSTWLNERRWAIMEVVLMLQASTAIRMRRSRREAQWSLQLDFPRLPSHRRLLSSALRQKCPYARSEQSASINATSSDRSPIEYRVCSMRYGPQPCCPPRVLFSQYQQRISACQMPMLTTSHSQAVHAPCTPPGYRKPRRRLARAVALRKSPAGHRQADSCPPRVRAPAGRVCECVSLVLFPRMSPAQHAVHVQAHAHAAASCILRGADVTANTIQH